MLKKLFGRLEKSIVNNWLDKNSNKLKVVPVRVNTSAVHTINQGAAFNLAAMSQAETIYNNMLSPLNGEHVKLSMLAKSKLMNWLKTCVVFDTETTGLGDDAQICEISIIDHAGSILLNTLVKPTCVIPDDVIAIHGITNEMVKDAPPWSKVAEKVQAIFMNRVVVAFNAKYDKRLLDQTSAICTPNLPRIYGDFYCAFEAYKVYRNEWNFDKNDYQRQSLINAAKQMGVEIQGKSHRALDDSQTTLEMMKAVAAA